MIFCLQALQRSGLLGAQPQVQLLKMVPRTMADVLDSILQVHMPIHFTAQLHPVIQVLSNNPLRPPNGRSV